MPKGISIHIGLNHVDPSRYGGWDGALAGCINDATDMRNIAQSLGYTPNTLLTEGQATSAEVIRCIGMAAQRLDPGDTLFLTYSGHGGQVPDVNGDEGDGQDETWVLWDRMLVDDELWGLWQQFRAGVRIIMLSDSCHSGSVSRMQIYEQLSRSGPLASQYSGALEHRDVANATGTTGTTPAFRLMPENVNVAAYRDNAAIYDSVQWLSGRGDKSTVGATVLLISGCLDNQLSLDGARNGLFTQRLMEVWNNGSFRGNYEGFHRAILQRMPPTQSPALSVVGAPNPAFEAEQPFTIGTGGGTSTSASPRPTIEAVASSVSVNAGPPRFRVNPGPGRYYAVEVTTRADLFNLAANGSQRTASNFYGSWATKPFRQAASYPTEFEVPADVWNRLKSAGAPLYFRAWGTDSSTGWVNQLSSTRDADASSAPSIQMTAAASQPAGTGPTITPNMSSVPNSSTPPRFLVNPGPGKYYAVEVATRPELFNLAANGSQRTADNFFGSWVTKPFPTSGSYPVAYDIPSTAWERLRQNATQLYYRAWATDSPTGWVNQVASVRDANASSAPSIQLTAREMEEAPVY
jgi:metacaspase-1